MQGLGVPAQPGVDAILALRVSQSGSARSSAGRASVFGNDSGRDDRWVSVIHGPVLYLGYSPPRTIS